MRVLITGISGFAGSHLAEHLLNQPDIELWGTHRRGVGMAAHLADQVTLRILDLLDPAATQTLLAECRPDQIYHLAGQAFVAVSWQDPWPTLENNIRGQLNLLQAMVELDLPSRILCIGSMEIFGNTTPDDLPIAEDAPFRPKSPYGVSKIAQDMLALQFYLSYQTATVRARPFNHIGPRQDAKFAIASFAKQIAEIEAGLHPPVLKVGNLEAQRDFTDVRDMVRAYQLLLQKGEVGEAYNIGRGEPYRVRDLLEGLLALTSAQIEIETDPTRLRPAEVPIAYADIRKLQATTGWAAQIPAEQSLYDVLEDWRERVAVGDAQ